MPPVARRRTAYHDTALTFLSLPYALRGDFPHSIIVWGMVGSATPENK